MKDEASAPLVTSPHDPRLAGMGMDDVAGEDQIDGMLAMTPDDRLDSLVAMARFADDQRVALRQFFTQRLLLEKMKGRAE